MPHEKLIFAFGIYEGETDPETGLRHGEGVLTYHNGNIYNGSWTLGAATGTGTKTWANGDSYQGTFLNGKKHGRGRYSFSNGSYYCGEYADDSPCGQGIQQMANGDRYEGEWRNGRRHGEGVEALHDGRCFTGTFVMGKKSGRGTLREPDGTIVTAVWDSDRCIEVISQENPSNESSQIRDTRPGSQNRAPLPMNEMLAEMEAAGLDRTLVNQIAQFNTNVLGQMDRVMNGLGSLDDHLLDLEECLEDLGEISEGDRDRDCEQ